MTRAREMGPVRGRGASWNPANRFDGRDYALAPDEGAALEGPRPGTEYLPDRSRSVLVRNDSPDVGFDWGLNPYRGCEHGCIYCYARPSHEYLGYSAGLEFETRILVKEEAAALLRDAFGSRRWQPAPVALSGNTDCYQPIERRLGITRQCLEVFAAYRNPVGIVTKNRLVLRDIDLLGELASLGAASVAITVTTLDLGLNRILEPRTSTPSQRLETIHALAAAGIPVHVLAAPVIPGLTDHEIPGILRAAAEAGACSAGYIMLRLPLAVAPLFEQWLAEHFPERREKVLNRIRAVRGGRLNESAFGARMRGAGPFAEQVARLFQVAAAKAGLDRRPPPLETRHFRRPGAEQLELFD